jgi:hypothetical protein
MKKGYLLKFRKNAFTSYFWFIETNNLHKAKKQFIEYYTQKTSKALSKETTMQLIEFLNNELQLCRVKTFEKHYNIYEKYQHRPSFSITKDYLKII